MYAPTAPDSAIPPINPPPYSEQNQHQVVVGQTQPFYGYPQPHPPPPHQPSPYNIPIPPYVQPTSGVPQQQPIPYQNLNVVPVVPGQGQPPYVPAPGPNQGYPQPIIAQPQPTGWNPQQPAYGHCPPGLEYLTMIDQLLVHQKVELLEAFTGFETNNNYSVKNSMGQKIYAAKEKSDCCSRLFCGPLRSFEMKISDNSGNEVIHLHRPLACNSCLFPCCLQSLNVYSPPGNLIGSVQQEWSIFEPKFSVKDASGEIVLKIKGPFCTFSMCGDIDFKVYSRDGSTKVGKISKQWSGFLREAYTDADMFGINFPMDLDVKMKAVMLGACFLIDFMFFEKSGNRQADRPGML